MTAPARVEGAPPSEARGPRGTGDEPPLARLGRRLGLAVVIGLFVYLVSVAFASIPAQVFWPARVAPAPGVTCAVGLKAQADELSTLARGHTGAVFSGAWTEPAGAALTEWDRRQAGLETLCRAEGRASGKAHHALDVLRHRLETRLDRMDRSDKRLLESLRSLSSTSASCCDTP